MKYSSRIITVALIVLVCLIGTLIWIAISVEHPIYIKGYANGEVVISQFGSEASASYTFENLNAQIEKKSNASYLHVEGFWIEGFCEPCDFHIYEHTVADAPPDLQHYREPDEVKDSFSLIRTGGTRLGGHFLISLSMFKSHKVEPGDETIIELYKSNKAKDQFELTAQCLLVNNNNRPTLRLRKANLTFIPGEAQGVPHTDGPPVASK